MAELLPASVMTCRHTA